jgi:hypothetical protein
MKVNGACWKAEASFSCVAHRLQKQAQRHQICDDDGAEAGKDGRCALE